MTHARPAPSPALERHPGPRTPADFASGTAPEHLRSCQLAFGELD